MTTPPLPRSTALGAAAAAPLLAFALALGGCAGGTIPGSGEASVVRAGEPVTMNTLLAQRADWYSSEEAVRIAENVLLYQRANGGWPRNRDMVAELSADQRAALRDDREKPGATIDNRSTYPQIRFLARVHTATSDARFRDAALRGVDYLLDAQYENGGWPQYWPLGPATDNSRNSAHNPRDLSHFITLNDNAMAGVLDLLLDVARGEDGFAFVDGARKGRAKASVDRAVELLLDLQVAVDGNRTAWAAQYDERTLEPRWGRKFEPVSLAGNESVGIARFLMRLEEPSPRVVDAIQSAVAWFDATRLEGVRVEVSPEPMEVDNWNGTVRFTDRHDRTLVKDSEAPSLWARFYEIGTNRPVFASDDDTIRYRHDEITPERRSGYDWFGDWPRELLQVDYPAWAFRQRLPASDMVVRERVTSLSYEEAKANLRNHVVPDFWKSRVEDVAARVATLERGSARVIATSPGGRPVHLVTYGEREPRAAKVNFNSAVGGRLPQVYRQDARRTRPVVLFVGPVHGQEVEGLVGLMNLIEVMETGRDLLGREQPELRALGERMRLLIIPTGNPDGVARFEPGHVNGLSLADKEFWGQGTWADGTLAGYPAVKLRHPMVGDSVGHLGSYFNDAGVNPMHEEFFQPFSTEAPAILDLARAEAPDLAVSQHSHKTAPAIIRPTYVPWEVQEEVARLAVRYNDILQARGLPSSPPPEVQPEQGDPPPYFNLVSALYHVSGTTPFTHENVHGLKGYVELPLARIIDVELALYEAMLRHVLDQ